MVHAAGRHPGPASGLQGLVAGHDGSGVWPGAGHVPTYKDFPLIKQAGLPGFEYTTWYGLFGPVGVPPAVVEKLGTALGKLAADKAFEARLREQGVDLHVSAPQELAERTRKETAAWDKVIRESGLHLN
ncbi:MAG: tripartite tricarboxylate transporter substrate-binding protein [Comamonas sp.]